jgi:hypothetical protein
MNATKALLCVVLLASSVATAQREAAAQTPLFTCGPLGAGSYFLAQDIHTLSGPCFTLQASGITINFNGFSVRANNGIGAAITDGGVPLSNIAIIHGKIQGFAVGIDLGSSTNNQIVSMNVDVSGLNPNSPPFPHTNITTGKGSTISDSIVLLNQASDGIHVVCPSLLVGNNVSVNTAPGGKALVESGKGCKKLKNAF